MSRLGCSLVVLALIGTTVAGCGGTKKSGASLDAQYRKAMAEPDPAARVNQLLTVAHKQGKAGDLLGMEQLLECRRRRGQGHGRRQRQGAGLEPRRRGLGKAGRASEAKSLLRDVSKAADQITEDEIKVSVLSQMAFVYGKYLNRQDVATGYLKNWEETGPGIQRPEGRM